MSPSRLQRRRVTDRRDPSSENHEALHRYKRSVLDFPPTRAEGYRGRVIARLRVRLPFTLHVVHVDTFSPHEFPYQGFTVRIWCPSRSKVQHSDVRPNSDVPLRMIVNNLEPAEPQPVSSSVLVDGTGTIEADMLQIDFIKPSFDRRPNSEDPPKELLFLVVNRFLARLRTLTRAAQIQPLRPEHTFWRVDYIEDDGSPLARDERNIRRRANSTGEGRIVPVTTGLWLALASVPADFEPSLWDSLLLDAFGQLPNVGPAIVLANTALEIRIATALDALVQTVNIPPALWQWINDRGDYRKEPSVSEQFDSLLAAFTGKSLKEESVLWGEFQKLRQARNSFAHDGRALIGKSRREEVTPEIATKLLQQAHAIIDWIDALLPAEMQRPKLGTIPRSIESFIPFDVPEDSP
jgi:hypothetical protein